jgi:hypothetical protein
MIAGLLSGVAVCAVIFVAVAAVDTYIHTGSFAFWKRDEE